MIKVNPSVIFCDIDATVTDDINDGTVDFREAVFAMFAEKIAHSRQLSKFESRELLEDYTSNTNVWWDYPDIIINFNLEPVLIWKELKTIHEKKLHVYEDAVNLIKYLSSLEKNVYIVSNNPVTGCLMKLEQAGLASLNGTKFFKRIFGTNITHGMKSQLLTWERIIASFNVNPEQMLTIGDHLQDDLKIPQEAGIGYSFIIDRKSEVSINQKRTYTVVNNFNHLKNIIS
jgi:FMN phosphatase YigB (HAD superfamily)